MTWPPPRDPSGFILTPGPGPIAIALESERIDDCMSYYRERGLTSIICAPSFGFRETNLGFFRKHNYVRRVIIPAAETVDVSGLNYLENSLEGLIIAGYRGLVDLPRFRNLVEFRGTWTNRLRLTEDCTSLRTLSLSKYSSPSKNLTRLPVLPQLLDLSIVQSGITTIDGVTNFAGLERLELSYLTQLVSIAAIQSTEMSRLAVLECLTCKKLRDHASVRVLGALHTLRFNDCGTIPSLAFLNEMPRLRKLAFVRTKVSDGNLTPVLRLDAVGFSAMKGFSHTPAEVKREIARRRGLETH